MYLDSDLNKPSIGGASGKESTCQCRSHRVGLIPGSGGYFGVGNGNPLQYSCLENPMDRQAWRATVHGVTKSQTQLKQLSMRAQNHLILIMLMER